MSKFSKHLGLGEPLMIDGEEFILQPLGTEYLPDLFKVMKSFSGAKPGASTKDILSNMTDEGLNSLKILINKTLEVSYPNEDKKEMQQFGLRYMGQLMGKIMELNSASVETDDMKRKKKLLDKVKGKG